MPFVLATSKNIHIETNTNHIVEDKDKNLWFTTVGQGIFKYNTITNHLEQYEFKNENGLMASVLVDSENQIWAITNWGNSGLFKLNKAENKFETFPLSYESGKHDSNALVMLEDSEHTLWLGTWECGLQKSINTAERPLLICIPQTEKVPPIFILSWNMPLTSYS